ncbi:hypothetical protein DYST_04058 [Dyella terrae]|nr:hypothetical protein DYST_04058 [Dyella terrae]
MGTARRKAAGRVLESDQRGSQGRRRAVLLILRPLPWHPQVIAASIASRR